jgi:hypothetical protein
VDPEARVSGKTETRLHEPPKSRFARPGFYLWRLIWLAAAFVTGLLLHRLSPGLFAARPVDGAALLRAVGVGFVVLVVVPAAAIIVACTLVGLPVGLFVLGLWLAGLYVGSLLVAALVGRSLMERAEGPPLAFATALLIGLVLVTVAVNVPYLGALVRLAVTPLGLGLGYDWVRRSGAFTRA